MQQKPEWKTPELVVLVRSKPEEAVLKGCKTYPYPGSGPDDLFQGCTFKDTGCDYCSGWSDS
jgi:hypothetical protein